MPHQGDKIELRSEHVKWDQLYNSKEYKELVHKKRRFIIPALVFFTIYYVSLLVIQGYFPSLASTPIVGSLNFDYLFAVSQLPVAWILCFWFIRYSQGLDELSKQVANPPLDRDAQPTLNTIIAGEVNSETL